MPWLRKARGAVLVAAAVFATAGAVIPAIVTSGGGGGGTTITCNQTAANSTQLASAQTAATTGQTVCLTASVDYGTWGGTNKAITIIAQSGTGAPSPTSPTMNLALDASSANFTLDGGMARWDTTAGLTIHSAALDSIAAGSNITLKNFHATPVTPTSSNDRLFDFDNNGPACNTGFTIDHGFFNNVDSGEAAIYVFHTTAEPCDTGITIKNTLFRHESADGIKLSNGAKVTIRNNKLVDFACQNGGFTSDQCANDAPGTNHTDGIQYDSGTNSVIRGNWIDNCEQAYFGSDGESGMLIEHNVVRGCVAHWITMGGDNPASTVRFNTIVDTSGQILCGNKTGGPTAASLTNIYNNIAQNIALASGGTNCTPTRNDHNSLTSGATGSNFNAASITYAGGSNPATFTKFSDFCATAPTAVMTGSDTGGQVGVCGGDYNSATDGPPSGEGF